MPTSPNKSLPALKQITGAFDIMTRLKKPPLLPVFRRRSANLWKLTKRFGQTYTVVIPTCVTILILVELRAYLLLTPPRDPHYCQFSLYCCSCWCSVALIFVLMVSSNKMLSCLQAMRNDRTGRLSLPLVLRTHWPNKYIQKLRRTSIRLLCRWYVIARGCNAHAVGLGWCDGAEAELIL